MRKDEDLPLSELVAAFSYALDITEGQPAGHCIRSCWIGMHIGEALGLSEKVLCEIYFRLLLKDLGCSSNAARICALSLTDDLKFKHDFKWVDGSFPQVVKFALENTALGAGLVKKIRTVLGASPNRDAVARELIETRCSRGADIATRLGFGAAVAAGIYSLDEHWDGQGHPCALAGEEIPLAARIALLAQVVEVFHRSAGVDAALTEAVGRRGTWFDPELVDALLAMGTGHAMWTILGSVDVERAVAALAPPHAKVAVDEDYLDEIAAAFGEVVDSKSPCPSGHSTRVALCTDLVAKELGLGPERRRWLHRGALLHDVGKLGVSNAILDKPGKLDEAEWVAMRKHPVFTEAILPDPTLRAARRRCRRPSRAPRREGLSARYRRRSDLARDAHHHDGGHLRRHHGGATLPWRHGPAGRPRHHGGVGGHGPRSRMLRCPVPRGGRAGRERREGEERRPRRGRRVGPRLARATLEAVRASPTSGQVREIARSRSWPAAC